MTAPKTRAPKTPSATSAPRKSELTRERLIKAAATVVGRVGYAKASSAKIAEEAGIAAGGLYYYFATRDALFDALLPTLGLQMNAFVAARVKAVPWGLEREVAAFAAYLEYLTENPEFYAVFSEARVYAPKAYASNFKATMGKFELLLKGQRRHGGLKVEEQDLELAAHFLAGIRNYVSQLFLDADPPKSISIDRAVRLYRQLIGDGFFAAAAASANHPDHPPA